MSNDGGVLHEGDEPESDGATVCYYCSGRLDEPSPHCGKPELHEDVPLTPVTDEEIAALPVLDLSAKTYPRVTAEERRWLRSNWRLLVNTGGNSLEHVLDLLNDWRRDGNNDLSVNLPRYLLGFGIDSQLGFLRRLATQPGEHLGHALAGVPRD